MKNEKQIRDKIAEHESAINRLAEEGFGEINAMIIENYIKGRKALLWVLSDNAFIETDEYEKKIGWELTCARASEMF